MVVVGVVEAVALAVAAQDAVLEDCGPQPMPPSAHRLGSETLNQEPEYSAAHAGNVLLLAFLPFLDACLLL